jgi:hypothetical protein
MKIDLAKSGYRTFSKNISEFAKINEMPIPLDIRRIDEGDGIEAAFIKKEAKYHESCRLMFNNTICALLLLSRQGKPNSFRHTCSNKKQKYEKQIDKNN